MSYAHVLRREGSPTVVALHGTGGDERETFAFAESLAPARYGLVAMRGNEPERGANRWFRRLAEGVFDIDNLHLRTQELIEWVKREVPGPRIAMGFSNGANIAAVALLTEPGAFDAAVLLAPMVPFTPDSLPRLDGKPVLMVCGEADPIVPRLNAQTLASMLELSGANLDVHWHPGGHSPDAASLRVVAHFLAKFAVENS